MASSKKITSSVHAQPEAGEATTVFTSVGDAPAEVQQIIVRQETGWQTSALLFLSVLLLTTIGVAFYSFHRVS